jgi:hypothetical protein
MSAALPWRPAGSSIVAGTGLGPVAGAAAASFVVAGVVSKNAATIGQTLLSKPRPSFI